MATTITTGWMRSDRTWHGAELVGSGRWRVSWLPGRLVSRDRAVTALMLAETLAAHPAPGARAWLVAGSLAAELGLTARQAAVLIGSTEPSAALAQGGPAESTAVRRPGGPSA